MQTMSRQMGRGNRYAGDRREEYFGNNKDAHATIRAEVARFLKEKRFFGIVG